MAVLEIRGTTGVVAGNLLASCWVGPPRGNPVAGAVWCGPTGAKVGRGRGRAPLTDAFQKRLLANWGSVAADLPGGGDRPSSGPEGGGCNRTHNKFW